VSVCPKCGAEAKVIASIEDQGVIDKILNHLEAKGALASPPELLPAAWASPDSDCFVSLRTFRFLHTVQQQNDRLPGGLLPELSRKARKAVEERGLSRKFRELNGLKPDRRIFQAIHASSFMP
jgi:hypothetical protein